MAWLAIFLASTPFVLAEQSVVQESLDDPSQRVTLNNWHTDANLSWVTSHLSIRPSMLISRGGRIHEFEEGPSADIGSIGFDVAGASTTVDEALEATYTDGIIVIKNGAVVYEQYFGDFDESRHHAWASSTKSLTGIALGILISNGAIDIQKSPAAYLPALRDSDLFSSAFSFFLDATRSARASEFEAASRILAKPVVEFTPPGMLNKSLARAFGASLLIKFSVAVFISSRSFAAFSPKLCS